MSGVYGAEGTASVSFDVADNPAAVGLDLPWQAFDAAALHLGNLERTLLTDL